MAQPSEYDRVASFTSIQALAPSDPLPGNTLDAEFNAVKATLDEILDNLALLQRDDGALANESVGLDQLSTEIEVGWTAPEVWVTATAYVVGNTVFHGSGFYRCLVAHTAGTFSTDLSAAKWELIVDLSTLTIVAASQIANTPAGSISSTNVQAAIDELASEKAATSHTHPSSAITDSTAAGRAMLTAANVAAQQTLLGLGSLAYLNSVPVTEIAAQLAFTGDISPSALGGDTNDWTPTGWTTAAVVKLSGASAISITGFSATSDGDIKILENTGSYAITLPFESTSSSAANRLAGPTYPASTSIPPGNSLAIIYDGTASRWRTLNPVRASVTPLPSAFKNLVIKVASNTTLTVTADFVVVTDGTYYQTNAVSSTINMATTGADALDTGTIAINTWYYVWVVAKLDGTTKCVTSTSSTSPTMPSGYTLKARVGAVQTISGSATLYGTLQSGRRAQYVVGLAQTSILPTIANGGTGAYSTTAPTWGSASVSRFVPPTASHISVVVSSRWKAGTAASVQLAPSNAYGGWANASGNVPPFDNRSATLDAVVPVNMMLESTTIYWASDATGGALQCLGWEDNL